MHLKWEYIKKLNDKKVFEKIEKKIQNINSKWFKKYILKYNSGEPTPNIFDTDKSKRKVFNALFSFNKNDEYNIFFFLDNFEHENLLPFAEDVSGDRICIDLKDNTIKLVDHETDEIEFVSNSLDEFMNSLYE